MAWESSIVCLLGLYLYTNQDENLIVKVSTNNAKLPPKNIPKTKTSFRVYNECILEHSSGIVWAQAILLLFVSMWKMFWNFYEFFISSIIASMIHDR